MSHGRDKPSQENRKACIKAKRKGRNEAGVYEVASLLIYRFTGSAFALRGFTSVT